MADQFTNFADRRILNDAGAVAGPSYETILRNNALAQVPNREPIFQHYSDGSLFRDMPDYDAILDNMVALARAQSDGLTLDEATKLACSAAAEAAEATVTDPLYGSGPGMAARRVVSSDGRVGYTYGPDDSDKAARAYSNQLEARIAALEERFNRYITRT